MRRSLVALSLAVAGLGVQGPLARAAAKPVMVTLKPPAHTTMMSIAHATGAATIKYSKHDADIKLTTAKLPAPRTLHAKVYVLWLVAGKQRTNAGSFKVHNGMGALHAMPMVTNFTKLVVTAESATTGAHPMGTTVLSGAVMHH